MIIDELLRQKEATAEQWMFKFQQAENEIARLRAELVKADRLIGQCIGWRHIIDLNNAEIERLRATQERRWCTVCGTVSRDDSCDCRAEGKAPQFVNYADEQNKIARELQAEVERLRSRR